MNNELLKLQNIKIEFKNKKGSITAVEDLVFAINKGEILGIVGESGSGKTISAMSILGLLPQNALVSNGKIYYKGENLLEYNEKEMGKIRGKEISMIFQDPIMSLDQVFTVGDQIIEAILTHTHISKQEARELALDLLDSVEISNPNRVFNSYPFELSGGMCQRIMIAIALSCNPDLIIADEPTTALDVTIQAQIMDLLKDIKKKNGTSIILITHDLGIVADMCETIIVMYAGKIMEKATTYSIFEKTLHPYTIGLLNSVPKLGQNREKLYSIKGVVPDLNEVITGCKFANRCEYAKEVCFKEEPGLLEVYDNHFSRCHFSKEIKAGDVNE